MHPGAPPGAFVAVLVEAKGHIVLQEQVVELEVPRVAEEDVASLLAPDQRVEVTVRLLVGS